MESDINSEINRALKICTFILVTMWVVMIVAKCNSIKKLISVEDRIESFELVEVDPPKHFYVRLLHLPSHELHRVFISKHFNRWREIKLHSKFELTVREKTYEDGVVWEFYKDEIIEKLNSTMSDQENP